ncbi:MAG: NAD(P)/FAD-dependent oxidoreductase [Myxococcota bacterium]|nr:NAD(P)/FAD-dependent oxidoreductase [Myxococcota bacterium]
MSLDVLIVGAGPAGLCAAWEAQQRGWLPVLLERGAGPGGVWSRVPGEMRCLSPRRRDLLPDGSSPPGSSERARAAEVLAALEDFASRLDMDCRFGTEAERLEIAEAGELIVHTRTEAFETRRLVIATGEYDRPVLPSLPGIASASAVHSSDFDTSRVGPGDHVLVVGARASASDLVERLLALDASITLSARGPLLTQPKMTEGGLRAELLWRASGIPTRLLPRSLRCSEAILPVDPILEDARLAGHLRVVGPTVALSEGGVRVEPEGLIEADHVVFATGYRRDLAWLGRPALSEEGEVLQSGGISTTVPGLAFLGIPCMRTRRSGFLRGLADDAAAVVGALA